MKDKSDRKFLFLFLICSLSTISFIGLFNYFMNPYDYFETPIFQGFNNKKLPGHSQERFDRVINIIRKKPQALMLGSSRVRAGFPASHYSHLTGYPAYKAAFAGARFNEIYGYFEHALINQPDLKAVFISLDFFAFSKNITPISEYSEERLRRTTPLVNDLFKLLLSQTTLKYSYSTYQHNRDPQKFEIVDRVHVKIDEDDYIDLGLPMIDSPQDFLKAEKRMVFDEYAIDPDKVAMFRKIVQTCQEKKIDLKVIFTPVNVLYWETIYQCDRWKDFENLKRELSALYPIYDFSGYSTFNCEELSKETSGSYFFELSHFTPHYGKAILDKIYGLEDRCQGNGALLTKESIENHLLELRIQREAWAKQNPEKITWIQNQVMGGKGGSAP